MNKNYLEYINIMKNLKKSCYKYKASSEDIEKMSNIILKQQKEIKNLKEKLKIKSLVDLEKYSKKDLISVLDKEYISKDKIKVKLGYEENEEVTEEEILSIIKTMWEEFNRLENLEDKMVTQYISKNVIIEKIKELEKLQEQAEPVLQDIKYTRADLIKYLKELLGEKDE